RCRGGIATWLPSGWFGAGGAEASGPGGHRQGTSDAARQPQRLGVGHAPQPSRSPRRSTWTLWTTLFGGSFPTEEPGGTALVDPGKAPGVGPGCSSTVVSVPDRKSTRL